MKNDSKNPSVRTKRKERNANTYFFLKLSINLILIILGATLIGVILHGVQTKTALDKQRQNNRHALEEVVTILERNSENADLLSSIYHEGNRTTLDNIELVFSEGLFESIMGNDGTVREEIFTELSAGAGIKYLYLLSPDGTVAACSDSSLIGVNPAATAHMTQENLNRILAFCIDEQGNYSPVYVQNRFGSYYFYSKPYSYNGETYVLAVGADSSVLDIQIESLRDTSTVLSRMSVINDGFLFAVDRESSLFLYYKNGDDLLTGQNAFELGLSKRILQDGYNGIETIRGERYYCSAQDFGDVSIVVAASGTKAIFSHDKYVLFWSIAGFSIVMILCLVYAVIVRNDFVRREVEIDRIVLRKDSDNPIYFNKSVFRKVFPLMLLGILAVYGISFYAQTLLEITEGIEKSDVVLKEITGRYEENLDSRKIIEDYYESRFFSTARLITFIAEEKPEILNADSDRFHSTYDENGNRVYVLDDEGNHLKSVANSPLLQEICDKNRIDAIYLFDEDGRTIATNTSNWFFTLSSDANGQSYPFRQILEGKTDSLLQSVMTDDLGEEAQFVGVLFHYYTTVDSEGNTVYVSRYAFEEAAAAEGTQGGRTAGGITKHSSLLQIELDEDLAGQILAPTDAASILSTEMLDGGAVIMFDATPDHLCVYSPVEASIGRTAADLGVSSKAFSGISDFYGFSRINGTMYFQFYRYLNDYYFATAIPQSSMYVTRSGMAFFTAGVCMISILILLLTVTLTNKEEEMLYETMSDDHTKNRLNSAIYNIILPSGRSASTTRAQARWDNRRIPWNERTPELKLALMIEVILFVLFIYLLLAATGVVNDFRENSIFRYILSGAWDRSPNIFAFSACGLVLAAAIIVLELFKIPVRLSTALLGTRGETIGHLLLSVLKYGGVLGSLFYCLYLVGIDSASLLASAGILSLVIGLGAQSLIQDILAGIFIVFEGEFRVGDIVTISDFRGTVMDIGLRTTKIMAPDGNIKIFNNSNISGVLNMTKETSVASATISFEYGQDVDYVEAVLARELPLLKEKNDKILDGPTYLGLTLLGDSGVSLTIIAKCTEQNVRGMNRYLNKELLKIFYRNGINVPFPNVTVSQLDTSGRKTVDDLPKEEKEDK